MLNRLVGRAVFAKTDGIVGHDINNTLFHQRGQTDGRATVVSEGQEGSAVRDAAAMDGEAVHNRAHGKFAHAVMDVLAFIAICSGDCFRAFNLGIVRWCQVSRAPNKLRQLRHQSFKGFARGGARGEFRLVCHCSFFDIGESRRGCRADINFMRVRPCVLRP